MGWVEAKAKSKKQDDTMVEFRVHGYEVHLHPQRVNIPVQGLDTDMC